ncbi:MAG: UDP-3-O-[3-hydroxymyristoyl] N-acetylglucosamine deacetylase [Thermoanaerobaculia bacterium]|nr:UDP-3-O-[3-hydroxymyristoyl] N-acetylglucosamine deacetylase [Thermoanaerobaculia bacterium]
MTRPLALIVDDEAGILTTLGAILADNGFEVATTPSGTEALDLYATRKPEIVFLDVWLPDRDGLETLETLREFDPQATIIMISGHGTSATAVRAIKMGAFDYLEKPLSYEQVMAAARAGLAHHTARTPGATGDAAAQPEDPGGFASHPEPRRTAIPPLLHLERSRTRQRTLCQNTVLYGMGLHSGGRTGMVLQPLPAGSGIHFHSMPSGESIPAHVSAVGDTDYATTLGLNGSTIKTVEHLLSALHAGGITNLLIKVHGEVPVLDGSAAEFCRTIEEIGVEEQGELRQEFVVDRRYEVGSGDKTLTLEPFDGFAVSYLLRYPPPIGEQFYDFELTSFEAYKREIAPARTFGFLRDLKMMNELGLGSGGRLDNFILVGEDHVVNTELRFPDEFVRHKILDIIGDLYLLGYPIRGRVHAHLTGHRDNIALVRKLVAENRLS